MVRDGDILPSKDAEELVDFTCASPWERLALDIELELRRWGLQDGQDPSETIGSASDAAANAENCIIDPPPIAHSVLAFGERTFALELRWAPSDVSLDSYPLERLLGVSKCVLLTADTPDGIAADDGSDAAVLLSAMAVAASGCGCSLPMIVPVGRESSLRFIGRQLHPQHLRFSCDFSTNPSEDSALAGLLGLFQNKRAAARRLSPPSDSDAMISAKFTYEWIDFSFKLPRVALAPGSFASDRRLSAVQTAALYEADPVRKIRITALWDEFPASDLQRDEKLAAMPADTASRLRLSPSSDLLKSLSSTQIFSTRIPLTSPARANLRMAQAACIQPGNELPAAPVAVINVRMDKNSIRQDIGRSPRASHISRSDRAMSPRVARAPAPSALDHFLAQVSGYVAAQALKDDRIDEEFLTSAVAALFEMDLGKGIMVDVVEALGPNAAEMTVLERVARLVAASESIAAAQKLWVLFLDGVEVHWEQQWIICGVPFSADRGPDHNESLMTQKLQMLNCCVERRRREAAGVSITMNGMAGNDLGRKSLLDGVELIGEGAVEEQGGERSVWEPFVQPIPLVTRDMVEEELKRMVLRAEGKDKSDEAEAKRQPLTLKSDMMAFKAANPNASLADFVRWFSPTDWVEDEDGRKDSVAKLIQNNGKAEGDDTEGRSHASNGQVVEGEGPTTPTKASQKSSKSGTLSRRRGRLSARMSRKGNIWEELWNSADDVAAYKQEPLFHSSEHGRKALGDLRAMPMTQVLLHLAVILGGSTMDLLQHAFSRPPLLPSVRLSIERARHAIRDVCTTLRLADADAADMGRVAAALDAVAYAEHMALVATSVLTKLPPTDGIGAAVDRLANGESVDITDERERALIITMAGLDGASRSVLLPEWREIVLLGAQGDGVKDRMYARVSREEFRIAFRLALEYGL